MPMNISILHLEDLEADSILVKSLISKGFSSFDYYFVEDEAGFLKALEENNIDIILSDYQLPDYSGAEALIASKKLYPDIPFIFVTGKMGEDTAIESMVNGATDYVMKSKPERLIPAIKRALFESELKRERINANYSLQKSEEMLKSIIEKNPLSIQIVDHEGFTLSVNPAHTALFGAIPPAGFSIFEDLQKRFPETEKIILDAKKCDLVKFPDTYYNAHDVSPEAPDMPLWIRAILFPLNNDHGKPERFVIMHENISERKVAEADLLEANWKFQALFDKGPIGVAYHKMIYDDSGKPVDFLFLDANQSFRELTGVDPRGKTVTEAFPGIENDPFDWIGKYGHIARTGETARFEQYLQFNDRWYDVVGFQYKPDHFVAAFLEITKRKKAETALKESELSLQQAQEIAKMGNWEYDVINRKNTWSKNCFVLFGLQPDELDPSFGYLKSRIHPDDLHLIDDGLEIINQNKAPLNIEMRITFADGTIKWLQNNIVPVFHEDRLVKLKGINLDITDHKHAELEILQLNRELDQRVKQRTRELEKVNQELETFSYSISHDLQAPLRHITGFIDLFLDKKSAQLSNEDLSYLNIVSASAKEMGQLIEAILSFSRLNQSDLRKITIHSSAMVQQVIRFFGIELENRTISFNVESLPDVNGDEELIRQVWTNLISNAVKYTSKKPETVIHIGSEISDNEITFFVKDNGAGFNMKYADKLFGVFHRLHKSSDFDGVGIGLAIVNRIVTRHGGHCRAEGEIDNGATFYFTLPK